MEIAFVSFFLFCGNLFAAYDSFQKKTYKIFGFNLFAAGFILGLLILKILKNG